MSPSRKPSAASVSHELEIRRVARFCEARVPARVRDKVRLECEVDRHTITIVERRVPWSKSIGPQWTRSPIARLRFTVSTGLWSLYYRDRNERWHAYDLVNAAPTVAPLLEEIDKDPTAIFWG